MAIVTFLLLVENNPEQIASTLVFWKLLWTLADRLYVAILTGFVGTKMSCEVSLDTASPASSPNILTVCLFSLFRKEIDDFHKNLWLDALFLGLIFDICKGSAFS